MNDIACLLVQQGLLSEAEPLLRNGLRCRRETLGEMHPGTLKSMNNLAVMLSAHGGQDQLSEAEQLHCELVRVQRDTLGAEHEETLKAMDKLSRVRAQMGAQRCGDDDADGAAAPPPDATET
jgi:hypothetical protein